MKRSLIAFVLGASMLTAGVADAAVRGTYRGGIAQGGTIAIKISKTKRVTEVAWVGAAPLPCEDDGDGDPSDDRARANDGSVRLSNPVRLDRRNRFVVGLRNFDGSAQIIVTGRVRDGRITGTWTEHQTYNLNDEPDPAGPTDCDSGARRYTARK